MVLEAQTNRERIRFPYFESVTDFSFKIVPPGREARGGPEGEQANQNDTVCLDLWESYLEPA